MPVTLKYEDGKETTRQTVPDYILDGGIFGKSFRDRTESARILQISGIVERYGDSFQVEEHSCDAKGQYRCTGSTKRIDTMIKEGYVEATSEESEGLRNGKKRLLKLVMG